MKRKILLIITTLMVFVMMAGCAGKDKDNSANAGDDKIKVVTTIFAPYDFVRNIAGDNVELKMLLSPGEESHSYDPTPQDIIAIQECDLFIYNGGENDAWVDSVIASFDEQVKVIRMMECVSGLLEEEIVEGMQHDDTHEHEDSDSAHEGFDEHVWASPANAISIVNTISAELQTLDAANAATYKENCEDYVAKLQTIDDDIKNVVENAKRKLVVFGDRFPLRYFVDEFGLDYYAAFPGCSAESEVNSQTIAFLIDKMKLENIPVVFKIELSNGNVADTISEETGAVVKTFYACHNISKDDFDAGIGYVDMMSSNVESLKEALN